MESTCTICGSTRYESFSFKAGHVCEECLDYIKNDDSRESADSHDSHDSSEECSSNEIYEREE
ncbi:MAG: hypothetical protein KBS66_02540 [Eubacterium sp.]|nr:hypothetical protein [Candidatus Colimonas fimequi]